MKKLILSKLDAIREAMATYNYKHLYWLNEQWQSLRAQELLLIEIMNEHEATIRQPLIDNINKLWSNELLTKAEWEKLLNDVQVQDNY